MKYPYLLFDADNTLFDFDAAEKDAHRQVCGKHRLAFTEEGYALYRRCNAQLWQDFDRGLCSKEFLLTERFRRYLSLTGETGDPEAMNRDHLRALGESAVLLPTSCIWCPSRWSPSSAPGLSAPPSGPISGMSSSPRPSAAASPARPISRMSSGPYPG